MRQALTRSWGGKHHGSHWQRNAGAVAAAVVARREQSNAGADAAAVVARRDEAAEAAEDGAADANAQGRQG